jgi:RNA polymerase sigma-70 factor (ECF subfamily)
VTTADAENGPVAETSREFDRLLREARAGSRKALGELIEYYRPYLLLIANQEWDTNLQGKMAPSDLVQESLLSAQMSLDRFQGSCEDSLRAWLRGILINNVLEATRHFKGTAKRQADRERPLDGSRQRAAIQLLDGQETPSSEAASQEEAEALNAAISRLPEDYQTVLRLRNWKEMSFVEIGQTLQKTPDAVRKLWSRAILQLEHELQNHDQRVD